MNKLHGTNYRILMKQIRALFKPHVFSLLLLTAISCGGITGYYGGERVLWLKPLGDIFLNLIFSTIVPLIFFSIAASIARAQSLRGLGKTMLAMVFVFTATSFVAAVYALIVVLLFPPAQDVALALSAAATPQAAVSLSEQIVQMLTVNDFSQLLSHQHIMPLIVFSLLVGIAALQLDREDDLIVRFLVAGEQLCMRLFNLIMYSAPIGFFAYFAVLVAQLGPQLISSYLRVTIIYYSASIIYFLLIYTVYAYLAAGMNGIRLFWSQVFLPAINALATCSSAASIPANLQAAKNMNISAQITDTVVPLGSLIHKEGSVIGGMIKIAFLFGIFHLDFSGVSVLATAMIVSVLVGTVMGAIPSGGMLGELLILAVYGFPPTVLMVIAAISIIIDPLATMLNVTGNTVGLY